MPRHLSPACRRLHPDRTALTETVPIGNGAMPDRSFIEWDKDDIDALGILKVDVLALGMLTCIRKCLDLVAAHHRQHYDLAGVPAGDPPPTTCCARAIPSGVFQVESRAQMAMLPKLRPREFYDLVIEVAIVRPGPIQGDMVHPYLRRRQGLEPVDYPTPGPEHPRTSCATSSGRTLGVPIFQEQAMKIALDAAKFTPPEANELRKALATFRSRGTIESLQGKMVSRMVTRGYDPDFAQRCFDQIKGFGEYGFPESHAASFAKLVYVSSWLKRHYPAAFACGLLNSQPMGFYAPAQIVRDARAHGVEVRGVDVNFSDWDNTLEPIGPDTFALRLGLRQVDGMRADAAARLEAARAHPFADIAELRARARLDAGTLRRLAAADAMRSMGLDRRAALWQAQAVTDAPELALFAAAEASDEGAEPRVSLPAMPVAEHVVADYQTLRLSLKAHPMAFFRASLAQQGYTTAGGLSGLGRGRRVRLAGLVLVRQKPGSAKGVCFITLEDETGVANLVIWPALFEAFRPAIMAARLLAVEGRVQSDGAVIHVVAERLVDRSAVLDRLSGGPMPSLTAPGDEAARARPDPRDGLPATTVRGDHVARPLPGQVGHHAHPRDARLIPRSRDFH